MSKRTPCPKCGLPMIKDGKTPAGAVRWRCKPGGVHCYTTTNPETSDRSNKKKNKPLKFLRPIGKEHKRFLVTSAQNATPIHTEFWESLKVAARYLKAEIIVIPLRYKNPTSQWTASQDNAEWWDEEVEPYLFNARKKLCPNLVLLGDIKIQPTASQPLTGLEGFTGGESSIVGHSKLQLKVIPVPAGKTPKILTTTGSCTVKNYTDSKAGQMGKFHHSLAAALVETEGKQFRIRQIIADNDGSFIDVNKLYTPNGVKDAPPALGLVMGDTHARFIDPKVKKATFGPGGIVEAFNPEALIWHDTLDEYAQNHHHKGNVFISFAKHISGFGDVREEVKMTVALLDELTGKRKGIVVSSNHDNFLSRYVQSSDWRQDPENAEFYLETALAMLRGTKMTAQGTEYPDPFMYWVSRLSKNPNVRCLKIDESFTLAGIEVGMHGHQGPNGSRGSAKNLSRLGAKTIIGHSHTPTIQDGCYQVGTSTPLRMEYTHGPSSWLNCHCAVYSNGKRSLVFMIDGKWTL